MERLLESLASAMEPFHHLDVEGWFSFSHHLTPKAAPLFVLVGLACALVGARHYFFRVFAAPLGILLGVLVTPDVVQMLSGLGKVPPRLVALALPAVLGLLCAILPLALLFVAVGLLGGLAGSSFFPEHEWFIGAALGFFGAGGVAVVFGRYLSVLLTALVGGLLAAGGLLALLGDSPIGRLVGAGPTGPLVLASAVAVAGAALQFVTHKDEEQHAADKADAREKRALEKENREREQRYSGGKAGRG